jgi:hypothetical protein
VPQAAAYDSSDFPFAGPLQAGSEEESAMSSQHLFPIPTNSSLDDYATEEPVKDVLIAGDR